MEDVSQRGAEQAETSVGSAECDEVRRGVEEAGRRAADVEATPEADELPDTGLSQDEAPCTISKDSRHQGGEHKRRERSTKGRTSRTGVGVTFA